MYSTGAHQSPDQPNKPNSDIKRTLAKSPLALISLECLAVRFWALLEEGIHYGKALSGALSDSDGNLAGRMLHKDKN